MSRLIKVQVKPNCKRGEKIEKIKVAGEYMYKVSVREAPIAGKANQAVMKVLAEYFGVKKDYVSLVSGGTAKIKFFKLSD